MTAAGLAKANDDFGPLFDRFDLTLEPGERTEILSPLFYSQTAETEESWGIPPLLHYRHDRDRDFAEFDLLYPILTWDRFGQERRIQLFQLLSVAGSGGPNDSDRRRFTLFPFYFQQRGPNPEDNYTALLPFYGHLQNRLFRDEVKFVLMPVYVQTRKKDVVTDNYLLPFFHLRHGEKLEGWQLWPLVGHEHKDPTTRTNVADMVEIVGGHDKLFVLWPFYFNNTLGIGTTNQLEQDLFLPLYSIQRSPARDTTTAPWPLGFTYTVDREKNYREWGAPWPLVSFARGEGKNANRVWPLFGESRNPTQESDFYFWPVYKYNRATSDPLDRERSRVFFFLYSDLIERNTQAKTAFQRTDLWPLFTARRDHSGNERFQLLAPLEPFLPANKSIERNYSPVWSVWRSEKNPKSGARSESLLWNFYRGEAVGDSRKCSLFFGLIQYQSDPAGQRWKLFHRSSGPKPKSGESPAKP